MSANKQEIINVLSSFRYLFSDVSGFSNVLFNDLVKLKATKKVVYPCDVIELKNILINEEIKLVCDVPLFSVQFSEKYLKRYPVFIVVNKDLINVDKKNYGGVVICKTNNLNIEDSILEVIINQPIDEKTLDTISNILSITGFDSVSSVSNSIPGISSINSRLS
jgi:hypothetical protein